MLWRPLWALFCICLEMCYILGMFKKRIYLDYASLTPVDPQVIREMTAFSTDSYANPSSVYKEGVAAKNALAQMRKKVADTIHAHADEIIFTSGGTESNVLALHGVVVQARMNGVTKPHIIISAIEHSSIIETARQIELSGCEVTRISVDARGIIKLDELKKAITPNTVLISVMTVNNEIGSIQPIKEIAHLVRKARASRVESNPAQPYPIFHTDAAQGFLYQELFVEKLGIDLMTLDGGKVYGPRGIGCLFVRRGIVLSPIIVGGGQENGIRSGTENLPAIAGFARALEIASHERAKESMRISEIRALCVEGLHRIHSSIVVTGSHDEAQSPHILNISIPGIDNEFFLFQLDAHGIACSTKSSCLRDEDESYVLKAVGANSKTSLRFSFGRWTKKGDIKTMIRAIRDLLSH